jgi:putative transcription factor
MVQCEMCGAETSTPKTVKVEGAELDVCDECADFGTEVKTESTSTTSTKYSTGSSGDSDGSDGGSSGGTTSGGGSGGGGSSRRSDMFDDMDELAQDYDERIRSAREDRGLSQSDLANELNEKASLIRKLERGETLPADSVQSKLERFLDVSLSAGGGGGEADEWGSDDDPGTTTLGDVVQRKD